MNIDEPINVDVPITVPPPQRNFRVKIHLMEETSPTPLVIQFESVQDYIEQWTEQRKMGGMCFSFVDVNTKMFSFFAFTLRYIETEPMILTEENMGMEEPAGG